MRYQGSLTVKADPWVAFDYLADCKNALVFHPPGTTIEQAPPDLVGVGTTFIFRPPTGSVTRTTITRAERPRVLELETTMDGGSPSSALWTIDRFGSATRLSVETESSFIGPRWARPFAALLTAVAWPLLRLKLSQFERRLAREIDSTIGSSASG